MLQHTIVGGMCYGLIAAHKVESMCGTAHRNAAFGAQQQQQQQQHWRVSKQQQQALNISHISQPGISRSHTKRHCLGIIWSILDVEGSHLGSENIWIRVNSRQLQLLQEALLNISHISHRGISGSHQASLPVLVLG